MFVLQLLFLSLVVACQDLQLLHYLLKVSLEGVNSFALSFVSSVGFGALSFPLLDV